MAVKGCLILYYTTRKEGQMASNTSTANDLARPLRRSTRLNQIIPVTVMGVDSYRGPYREEVATVTVSCHGCRYESKHDVLTNSWVMLELPSDKPDNPPVTARGLVKWVQRSAETAGLHQTAIELEDPSNIWGIETPPSDWLAYSGPRDPATTSKSKPFAVRKPEPPAPVTEQKKITATLAVSSTDRPLGNLMGDFQRQMEQTLFEAANTVVRERTASALDEVRAGMRDEARRLLAEAAAAQAGTWMSEFVKQMKQASHDSARALHTEWTKKITADLQLAGERFEEQKRGLEQHAQELSATSIERVERGLETSRKEAVNRIVGRLKEQVAPMVDDAKKVAADLSRHQEELEKVIDETLERSSVQLEQACARFEQQFEMIIQSRLDAAREELERAAETATNLALSNLQVIAHHNESEARARFQNALEPVAANALMDLKERATEASRQFGDELAHCESEARARFQATLEPVTANALIDLKERATEASRQFGDELAHYGRSYLEFVGGAVTDLAKGFGKLSKE
jgi:hypothetical protein